MPAPLTRAACPQCETDFEYVRTAAPRTYCNATCAKAAWRTRNPDREAARCERRRLARAASRGNVIATRESTCADCSAVLLNKPSGALRKRCDTCQLKADRARRADWRARNPDRSQEYRQRNPESVRASFQRWKAKPGNGEVIRLHARAYKARKRSATVISFSAEQLAQRLAMFGGRCWICGSDGTTIDHVKPLSKGGPHMLSNIRPACVSCNSRKKDKWPLAA